MLTHWCCADIISTECIGFFTVVVVVFSIDLEFIATFRAAPSADTFKMAAAGHMITPLRDQQFENAADGICGICAKQFATRNRLSSHKSRAHKESRG